GGLAVVFPTVIVLVPSGPDRIFPPPSTVVLAPSCTFPSPLLPIVVPPVYVFCALRVTGLVLLVLGLVATLPLKPGGSWMTSLTTIGPDRAARLRVSVPDTGSVTVFGAFGSPMINVPPVVLAVNPLEMNRLLVIVIAPDNVRLRAESAPVPLSIAMPVV